MIDETAKHILEIVTDIQEKMATKEDLAEVRTELKNNIAEVRAELKGEIMEVRTELGAQIRENTKAIEELREEVHGMRGYAKEIDHVISRVSVLEHHAGAR